MFGVFDKQEGKTYVMLQAEHFPHSQYTSDWQTRNLIGMQRYFDIYDIIWDIFLPNHRHHYEGYNAVLHTIGYHPIFDKSVNILKDKDTSFFGTLNDRRNAILDACNCSYRIGTIIDGAVRDQLIRSSKINLNIHFTESKLLETLRIVYIISNNGFVITEDFIGDEDLQDVLVFASKEVLPEVIAKYLSDHTFRREVQSKQQEYFITKRTMRNTVFNLIFHL
jgi:hypothetical protein